MRVLIFCLLWVLAPFALAENQKLLLASTTSTQNSGLYNYLLPKFTQDTGVTVHVVAVGTGQALRIAENGDADILIVHHRPSEEAFVASGFGIERRDLMFNDFVLVGPADDPANVTAATNAVDAFTRLQRVGAKTISRGDESGTHLKELEIWRDAGISRKGEWYREIGAGMGAALNMAAAVDGYLLSDRGTWLSFGNRGNLKILYEGDPDLYNPYGVILVNPAKHPHVHIDQARVLSDWLTSQKGQKLIAEFTVSGLSLFCPIAQTKAVCMPE
ncbi:MAG: solute-binding protein [Rhodobacteraceae bacterium]|nr:solute-binding protein [Paracoccaceae bacterium]